jgi:hypothetical protein
MAHDAKTERDRALVKPASLLLETFARGDPCRPIVGISVRVYLRDQSLAMIDWCHQRC